MSMRPREVSKRMWETEQRMVMRKRERRERGGGGRGGEEVVLGTSRSQRQGMVGVRDVE